MLQNSRLSEPFLVKYQPSTLKYRYDKPFADIAHEMLLAYESSQFSLLCMFTD